MSKAERHEGDENGSTIIVITHFMYIYSGNRGPSHATIISGSDASMLDLLEQELAIYNELEAKFNKDEAGYYLDPLLEACGPSRVVAFGHTHPGIGVFFSQTDHGSHYATDKAPFASVVCDPIQKQMKCMMGVDHADAQIIAYEAIPAQLPDKEDDVIDAECEQPARPMTKQELAQEIARYANLLLVRNGVKGSFDSYRSWRGWMCMDLELKYRTDHFDRKGHCLTAHILLSIVSENLCGVMDNSDRRMQTSSQDTFFMQLLENAQQTVALLEPQLAFCKDELTFFRACLAPGRKVLQKRYGTGKIMEYSGDVLTVQFSDGKQRRLDLIPELVNDRLSVDADREEFEMRLFFSKNALKTVSVSEAMLKEAKERAKALSDGTITAAEMTEMRLFQPNE